MSDQVITRTAVATPAAKNVIVGNVHQTNVRLILHFKRFLLAGICCISAGLIPNDDEWFLLRLVLLILGK